MPMHLTRHSDYSLRALIYLGTKKEDLATVPEIAQAYGISRGHLMKVVQHLGQLGYVETVRGRGGGITLARPPNRIRLGQVLRETEGGFALVDCFDGGNCRIHSACRLKGVFEEALDAFLQVLDKYTLADLLGRRAQPLQRLLQLV
jgi:Rrf2 family nitric oxide-sensitive transcriptional repressor